MKDKLLYTIKPTGKYGKQILEELKSAPRDYGCGDYGADGADGAGDRYFEYHPKDSKTKFLFINYGQEEPLYDDNSIELF